MKWFLQNLGLCELLTHQLATPPTTTTLLKTIVTAWTLSSFSAATVPRTEECSSWVHVSYQCGLVHMKRRLQLRIHAASKGAGISGINNAGMGRFQHRRSFDFV